MVMTQKKMLVKKRVMLLSAAKYGTLDCFCEGLNSSGIRDALLAGKWDDPLIKNVIDSQIWETNPALKDALWHHIIEPSHSEFPIINSDGLITPNK